MRTRSLLILLLLLCFGFQDNYAQNKKEPKHVLFLYAYDADFPTFPQVMEALNKHLVQERIHIDTEILNTKSFQSETYYALYDRIFKYRIHNKAYDLIITSDDNALDFALKHRKEYFPNTPLVFFGINDSAKAAQKAQEPNVTGIAELTSIQATIELSKKLNPNLDKIIAITDQTKTGQMDLNQFLTVPTPPSIRIDYLNFSRYTLDGFADTISNIHGDRAFLLLSAYINSRSEDYSFDQTLKILVENSNIPVYHLWHHGLGKGITGGEFVSHYQMAKKAAGMAKKILSGTHPDSIPPMLKSYNKVYLDYKQAKRFNLNTNAIEEEWQVINKPKSKFQVSPEVKRVLIFIFAILAGIFGFLIMSNRKQRKIKKFQQESLNYYQSLFEQNYISMILVEPTEGRIIQANEAACGFYGYTCTEMSRMYLKDLDTNEQDATVLIMQKALTDRQNIFAARHRLKNGEVRQVNLYIRKLVIQNREYLYTTILDVTMQREYEDELIAAKRHAEESDRLKSAFLSNLSHEVRTPLNSIVGFTDLLKKKKLTNVQIEKYAEQIYKASRDLTHTISQIIDIALIESGQLQLNVTPFSANELLREIFEQQKTSKLLKYIDFNLQSLSTDSDINGDRERIKQITENLLENAMKFTDKGEITLGAFRRSQAHVIIYVKDTGGGIPPEKQDIIFESFRQEWIDASNRPGGTGLGLTIAQKLTELHNGELWVDSDAFTGSVFYLKLPAV